MYGRFSNREVGCAKNGEVSGSKCEERRECGEMGSVKKEGDSVKKRENVTIRESKNLTYSSYVQLICTVPKIQLFQLGPAHYTVHNHTNQALTHPTSLFSPPPVSLHPPFLHILSFINNIWHVNIS